MERRGKIPVDGKQYVHQSAYDRYARDALQTEKDIHLRPTIQLHLSS